MYDTAGVAWTLSCARLTSRRKTARSRLRGRRSGTITCDEEGKGQEDSTNQATNQDSINYVMRWILIGLWEMAV